MPWCVKSTIPSTTHSVAPHPHLYTSSTGFVLLFVLQQGKCGSRLIKGSNGGGRVWLGGISPPVVARSSRRITWRSKVQVKGVKARWARYASQLHLHSSWLACGVKLALAGLLDTATVMAAATPKPTDWLQAAHLQPNRPHDHNLNLNGTRSGIFRRFGLLLTYLLYSAFSSVDAAYERLPRTIHDVRWHHGKHKLYKHGYRWNTEECTLGKTFLTMGFDFKLRS